VTASDYPDWSVPQTSADSIAATGVPLLTMQNSVGLFDVLVNPTSTVNIGTFPVTQPSYEISISSAESGAGVWAPMFCEMLWYDDTATVILAEETWYFWPGTVGSDHVVVGKGPTKGTQVSVSLTNTSASGAYTASGGVYQRSHIYTRDVWQSQSYPASMSASPVAPADPDALMLAGISVSLGAGVSNTWELPLWAGLVSLNVGTASNASDAIAIIQSSTDPNAAGLNQRTARFLSDATGTINAQFALGRSQNRITLTNNNATTRQLVASLYAVDAGC
jgi:hypothetical protein